MLMASYAILLSIGWKVQETDFLLGYTITSVGSILATLVIVDYMARTLK